MHAPRKTDAVILAADIAKYSTLADSGDDALLDAFHEHVLELVQDKLDTGGEGVHKLAGDGFLFIEYVTTRDEIRAAVDRALGNAFALARAFGRELLDGSWGPWACLQPRVALHYGKVTPVAEIGDAYSREIIKACRLEPKVTPGCVWATRAFTALAEPGRADRYGFEAVGKVELAKGFGDCTATQVVDRKRLASTTVYTRQYDLKERGARIGYLLLEAPDDAEPTEGGDEVQLHMKWGTEHHTGTYPLPAAIRYEVCETPKVLGMAPLKVHVEPGCELSFVDCPHEFPGGNDEDKKRWLEVSVADFEVAQFGAPGEADSIPVHGVDHIRYWHRLP